MRWWYTALGVGWCLAWLVSPGYSFVSKIRAQDGTKLACHSVSAAYKAYVMGTLTAQQALDRLNLLCNCTLAGADITDLTNFRGQIDAIGILEIGNTAGENNTELAVQSLRKLATVSNMESYCAIFEAGNDSLLNETQLRSLLNIP